MTNPADYWDAKTLCATRWILLLTCLPLLSKDSRKELEK